MPHVKTDPIEISINPDEDYTITITYGNGVIGGSSSFFNFKNEFKSGQITNSPLGKGSEIKGKTLNVSSTLTANNPSATFVSVIYKINGESTDRRKKIGDDMLFNFETDIIFK